MLITTYGHMSSDIEKYSFNGNDQMCSSRLYYTYSHLPHKVLMLLLILNRLTCLCAKMSKNQFNQVMFFTAVFGRDVSHIEKASHVLNLPVLEIIAREVTSDKNATAITLSAYRGARRRLGQTGGTEVTLAFQTSFLWFKENMPFYC